ncbi:hypothetical protein SLEP1_g1427 [Rubroshorea leprosula]|uniref:Uncharacterized protein n=1 Tax=Rubroshorea leprosula TaxID=152421 RepID=A0AAV5HPM4_9ROSI|nr:hypothetical protein SLEP1_g1427 [Rubroshorea leprosula]
MATSFCVCATPRWTNSSIPSVKQCKFVGQSVVTHPSMHPSIDVKAQADDEDMAVMNHVRSDVWVVMLDEHGLDIGSERFAELVGDAGSNVGN